MRRSGNCGSLPLAPRASEITFADRFSLAVIDSGAYLADPDKDRLADGFYNDTYLTDQNACTSPRMVVWLGTRREEAKEEFWRRLYEPVKRKYRLESIQAVSKLTSSCLAAAGGYCGTKKVGTETACIGVVGDNRIVRVRVPELKEGIMDLKDNSGYFFEYDCDDILELKGLCDDARCQTIAYLGEREKLVPLLTSGIRGVDRVVPLGHTMDFDLMWDGYDLCERLTRGIRVGI